MDENLEKAYVTYGKAFGVAPDDPAVRKAIAKAYPILGERYFHRRLLAAVLKQFEIAVFRDPHDLEARLSLAEAHEMVGNKGNALAISESLTDMWPWCPDAHYHLGRTYEARGRQASSLKAYQRAIDLRPRMTQAYSRIARILEIQGRTDEMIRLFRRAAERYPFWAWPRNRLGRLYLASASKTKSREGTPITEDSTQ
jgi:tetratricopeptide (TPR) repeat protein